MGQNDLFVIPNHTWYPHANTGGTDDAILYGISDRPLPEKIGYYRRQGRDDQDAVIEPDI